MKKSIDECIDIAMESTNIPARRRDTVVVLTKKFIKDHEEDIESFNLKNIIFDYTGIPTYVVMYFYMYNHPDLFYGTLNSCVELTTAYAFLDFVFDKTDIHMDHLEVIDAEFTFSDTNIETIHMPKLKSVSTHSFGTFDACPKLKRVYLSNEISDDDVSRLLDMTSGVEVVRV